jgi:hypothetical protein
MTITSGSGAISLSSVCSPCPLIPAIRRSEIGTSGIAVQRDSHALEAKLGFRAPARDSIARANAAAGIRGYLGTIAVVTARQSSITPTIFEIRIQIVS